MQYTLAYLWGIVLLAFFAGWGLAVRRMLRIAGDDGPPDWGSAIVFGMSWIIALGGILNVLSMMSRVVAWLLVLAGLVLLAVESRRIQARLRSSGVFGWPKTSVGALTLLICLVAYGTWVCLPYSPFGDPALRTRYTLNPWDDMMGGYVTYPLRMLSEGSLGDDPFNDRRTSSALGGHSLLQAFSLLFLPPTFIHVTDPGLAILGMPLVLHSLGRRRGWPDWLVPALTLFFLSLGSAHANASAMMLPVLFLLCLYRMMEDLASQGRARFSEFVALAMVAAGVMTLKQTLVPGTCLMLAIYFILDGIVRRDLARWLSSSLTTGLLSLLLLAPWLLSMYRAAGTPLYPLLGQGYRANPMVDLPSLVPIREMFRRALGRSKIMTEPHIYLYLLLGTAGLAASMRRNRREFAAITFIAVFAGSTATLAVLALVFTEYEFSRFGYPYKSLVLLTSFALLLGADEERAWLECVFPDGARWVGRSLIFLILAFGLYHSSRSGRNVRAVRDAITGNAWNPNQESSLIRQLQASIPPGRRFLAFLPMAHLLDFARNPIDVMDSNCAISPPPGMPLERTPEEVAQYLRLLGISWIATRETSWTSTGETRDPEDLRRWSERYERGHPFDSSGIYSHYLMYKCIRSLAMIHDTRRFDHDLLVINLDRPAGSRTVDSAWRSTQ